MEKLTVGTYAIGNTKVFLKQESYLVLEKLREVGTSKAAIKIQAFWRGNHQRKLYKKSKQSAVLIQKRKN